MSFNTLAQSKASRFLFGLMFVLDSKVIPSNSEQTFSDILVLPKLHASRAFQVGFDFQVIRQYRRPQAHPWESLWLFWSYNLDGEGQKLTNYIVFKPNGLEIGKAYKEVSQDFIWTQSQPQICVGQWHRVLFAREGVNLLLWLDGVSVPFPHLKIDSLYQYPGRIAFYVEDSRVMLRKIHFANLKTTKDKE